MTIEFWLSIIIASLSIFITEQIAKFLIQKIKSTNFFFKKPSTILIGNNQFEIKGLSEEKKREFNLLASTIVIQHPETGLPHGTGFIVNEKNAITTFHAVELATINNREKMVNVKFAVTGDIYQALVVRSWSDQDIAIIEFNSPLPLGVAPLEIASDSAKAGHKFHTFGYGGRDSFGLWATGEIMGLMKDNQNQERIQLSSTQIIPGMSGAPIIDDESQKVVGILTAIYADREKSRLETIAFATPIIPEIINNVT